MIALYCSISINSTLFYLNLCKAVLLRTNKAIELDIDRAALSTNNII